MQLKPLHQEFVLHFGEMGSRWGINRTVGQIYALLYLAPEPLNAEQIVASLGISRSNASMGLKELQAWNLVQLQHLPGDRRDYFTTPQDPWEIVRTLAEERRKREVEPTLSKLRELQLMPVSGADEREAQARISALCELIELLTGWHNEVSKLSTERIVQLLSLGARLQTLLDGAGRLVGKSREEK